MTDGPIDHCSARTSTVLVDGSAMTPISKRANVLAHGVSAFCGALHHIERAARSKARWLPDSPGAVTCTPRQNVQANAGLVRCFCTHLACGMPLTQAMLRKVVITLALLLAAPCVVSLRPAVTPRPIYGRRAMLLAPLVATALPPAALADKPEGSQTVQPPIKMVSEEEKAELERARQEAPMPNIPQGSDLALLLSSGGVANSNPLDHAPPPRR